MVQHEKQADGKVVVYEREVKGDEMHVVRIKVEFVLLPRRFL